ncbi:hypothetical protein ACN2XU_12745 [Primorskyibacter sp. 2E107]|uniref:hypothetical protein n=1 Tax=Primorskyibacter sp. 2E107 TaxID=3403458 RepID=UPI003AF44A78
MSDTPRIDVSDTSGTSPGDRDWALQFNDPGGLFDYFAIEDGGTNTIPFQIMGGAPPASFVMASDGKIGMGTAIPQTNLHMADPNTVALRMEPGGAGGRIWEVIATGGSFNLRDYTSGQVPFSIYQNAPSYSLSVYHTGNVGMGTQAADTALHVTRDDGTAAIKVENTEASGQGVREMFRMVNEGGSYFTLANTVTDNEWYFVHENNTQGRFMVNHSDGGLQMALTRSGDMTLMGELYTAGSCAAGCDRVFDEDYPLPTIAEQAALMRANKHLPNVGPTPEDGPFNITAMTGGMLNELEKAHLYIAELHGENEAQAAQIAAMAARLEALEQAD